MTELLPCPMCGGKAVASSYVIEAVVKCSGCQLKIVRSHGARDDNGYPEAIAAWNHRHSGGDGEDSARLDYIERTFSGMTNRARYLPVQMIWGKGANGRTLREACDKYMTKETPFSRVTFVEREMPPGVVAEVRTRHDRVTIIEDEDAARAGERGEK